MSKRVPTIRKPQLRLGYVCRSCRANLSSTDTGFANVHKRWITRNHIRRIRTAEEEWAERAEAIAAGKKQSTLSILEERGYINQIVGNRESLEHVLNQKRVGVYCGVDPTAPSLHVGHMVPYMALGWFYIHGYSSTFLLGGSTAQIGDPTDRLKARDQTAASTRKANMASMHIQLKRLGATMEKYAERRGYSREWAWRRDLTNNNTWWQRTSLVEVLKVMGSGMRIGPMLGRDTVKNKMEKGDGMSFAEFTYPIMQAWDWWELYKKGTQIQIGGADQFGNILAGAEAVKYTAKHDPEFQATTTIMRDQTLGSNDTSMVGSAQSTEEAKGVSKDPMGFTVPLLTTAAGDKFGKSAGNAIWLDQEMTSPFELYQFFLRSADADAERYLKLFTFLPMSTIKEIMAEHLKDQSKRVAQHKLAYEFVELIHGFEVAEEAARQHSSLFSRNLSVSALRPKKHDGEGKDGYSTDINPSLNKYAQSTTAENMGSTQLKLPRSLIEDQSMSKILWSAGLVASRSEGQRLINNGGAHIGSKSDRTGKMDDSLSFAPITSWKPEETAKYIIEGNLLILRIGKWKLKIVNIVSDEEYEKEGLTCPGWKEPAGDDAGRLNYKDEQKQRQEFLDARKARLGASSGERRGVPARGNFVDETRKERVNQPQKWSTKKGDAFGVVKSVSWR